MTSRLGFALSAALIASAAIAVPTSANGDRAARDPGLIATPNWSGYVVTGRAGDPVAFRSATGSWLVPAVRCAAIDARASSAVWVGLGGYVQSEKNVLEHVGTDSNCDTSRRPVYFAWFEVAPYLAFPIPRTLAPGDTVTATVTVQPDLRVELELNDDTRHWAFARTISLFGQTPASAEWIVSTPEICIQDTCALAHLPRLGTVRFSGIAASAGLSTGTLTDPTWQTIPVELVPGTTAPVDPSPAVSSRVNAAATPGPVSADGSAFNVSAASADVDH